MSSRQQAGGFAAREDYDGYEFVFENGYCARFEFKRDETRDAAHSFKYSLSGKRLVGFDNAHPVRRRSGRFKRLSADTDHWHRNVGDKGRPYDFKSPEILLEDFFREVDRVLHALALTPRRLMSGSSDEADHALQGVYR